MQSVTIRYIIIISTILFLNTLFASVVINEIMFNPNGSEYHDEFIEIYNNTGQPVNLNGWKVGDQDESDGLIPYLTSTDMTLQPFSYAIILDSSYPDNSQLYDQIIPATVLKLTIDDGSFGASGLYNSTPETVILTDNNSSIIDQVTYTINQDDGISDERLAFDNTVWGNSKSLLGTPGFKNSIVALDYDLSLELKQSSRNRFGEISAVVKNIGTQPVSSFHLDIFHKNNLLQQFDNGTIAAGDSVLKTFSVTSQTGTIVLTGKLETENDEYLANNYDTLSCFNNLIANSVRLNEFMKKPSSGNCEWLEIYNASQDTVWSADLAFRDLTSSLLKLDTTKFILPGNYLVLAKDSTILNKYSIPAEKLLYFKSLPALSDEDALYICDKAGKIIDSLIYKNNWTEEYDNSIEKINPLLNSAVTTNWVPSVNQATPGFTNSVFQEIGGVSGENRVEFNHQLVSPNDDGKNDQLVINYSFNSAYVYLTAEVYNIKGHLMRSIADQAYKSASSSIIYDCRDKSGSMLSMGAYILFISARNSDNKTHEFKKVFYIVK